MLQDVDTIWIGNNTPSIYKTWIIVDKFSQQLLLWKLFVIKEELYSDSCELILGKKLSVVERVLSVPSTVGDPWMKICFDNDMEIPYSGEEKSGHTLYIFVYELWVHECMKISEISFIE